MHLAQILAPSKHLVDIPTDYYCSFQEGYQDRTQIERKIGEPVIRNSVQIIGTGFWKQGET